MLLKKLCFLFSFFFLFSIGAFAQKSIWFSPDSANFPVRALWVTRWDYQTPEDIASIVKNAEWAGFNVIFFQVRGNGTVYYPSSFEPPSKLLASAAPNWDPLSYAIARAHLSGLQLHAWVNIFPGWRGTRSPIDSTQLWNQHPSWFLPMGESFAPRLRPGYSWLNPVLPEVQDHLCTLILELSEKYNLDGIHFDYFRYPGPGDFLTDAQNPLYQRFFNFRESTSQKWDAFRRNKISRFVQKCRCNLKRTHPGLVLSAAIFGDRWIGTRAFFQDSHRWVLRNDLDWVVPMTYTSDTLQFAHWLRFYQTYPRRAVLPGVLTSDSLVFWKELRIIRKNHFPGFSFFGYQSLFPNHRPSALAAQISSVFLAQPKQLPLRPEAQLTSPPYPERLIFAQGDFPLVSKQKIQVEFDGRVSEKARYFLVWKRRRPGALEFSAALLPEPTHPNRLITDEKILLGPKPGLYTFSLYQKRGSQKVLLREFNVPLLERIPRFHFESFWGIPIQGARHLLVDRRKQVWIPAGNRVIVLDSTGQPTRFSPILWGLDASGNYQPMRKSLGVCQDSTGRIWITNYNGKGFLFPFSQKGEPFPGIQLNFFPGDVTVAAQSRFFILSAENNHWHVLSAEGRELRGSPFAGTHRSYGIAVSGDGTSVFVSCRADGKVHHWAGSIFGQQAGYQKLDDLDVGDTGFGSLFWDKKNRLFVCQPGLGRIIVWDALHYRFLDVISSPMLRAPRAIAPIPGTHDYLILETSGETAVRLVRFRED